MLYLSEEAKAVLPLKQLMEQCLKGRSTKVFHIHNNESAFDYKHSLHSVH